MGNRRLTFYPNEDHNNNNQLGEYWKNSVIVYYHGPVDNNKTLIVNFFFGIENLDSEVQIFNRTELIETVVVDSRIMSRAVSVEGDGVTSIFLFLRPVYSRIAFFFYYLTWEEY